ncbi:hypothetical protein EG68_03677 [Paragonimus skrjabini miyazakii]|uniref:Reverse transcriptase domain-containing protein n=1 Tax=Paragonimus skrjabini miyazakii TaxID=59628 RepID=A0A8S9YK32_9TREM|nr:hypothetical protein EG68_03677 [Paragonimus skrjabini miyazakii]
MIRHASVFEPGLGLCTKAKSTLTLHPGVKPVFRPKRPVPCAALPIVVSELDRLQAEGNIQSVNYSEWAGSIVVVKKANGGVRICADVSTGLNAALKNYEYPLPVPEDLFTKLNRGQRFAKVDLFDAYLRIPVEEESRKLLTVNTHRRLFQYARLPFGIKTAPAIFQQIMDIMLSDLPGCVVYLDDIIIMGCDVADLVQKPDKLLSRIKEYGFRLRKEKCIFMLHSVKRLGFIIDKRGRHPDPASVEAIKAMPPPKDLSGLRVFLGLVSYYGAFIPTLHQLRGPLNRFLTKDSKWEWTTECQRGFEKVKAMITSDLLLTHFNPSLPIEVASDASNFGISALIFHILPDGAENAIAHAARSLTPVEKNNSQIKKHFSQSRSFMKCCVVGGSLFSQITNLCRLFHFTLQTDCNVGRQCYSLMNSIFHTGRRTNLAKLLPCHA